MKVQDITSVQAFDQALKTTDEVEAQHSLLAIPTGPGGNLQHAWTNEASLPPQVAVHFWAPWSAPCKQMDLVFAELAAQCSAAAFLRVSGVPELCRAVSIPTRRGANLDAIMPQVEAEEVPDVTERYSVSMVPHFLLIKVGWAICLTGACDTA